MQQYDGEHVLHYLDPPYVHSTRTALQDSRRCYRYEMTDDEHRELAEVARSCKGMVIISGYPSTLYDQDLYADWRVESKRAVVQNGKRRVERLWISPRAAHVGEMLWTRRAQ